MAETHSTHRVRATIHPALNCQGCTGSASRKPRQAGSPGSLRQKLWEGEIRDPVNDNRFIGTFEAASNVGSRLQFLHDERAVKHCLPGN
jgi:hypothetical protein